MFDTFISGLGYVGNKRGTDLFNYLCEVLGYDVVAAHFFDWLDSDTCIRALTDLADDYDIDINVKED